tara:strand:+ start:42 stop:566 length:525 start_codon:yes stop_codon:yes gene_type:complete
MISIDGGTGLVTGATLASPGNVIQVQNMAIDTNNVRVTDASSSNHQTWFTNYNAAGTPVYQRIQFTPKFATSKLLLLAIGSLRYDTGATGQAGSLQVRIIDVTNSNTEVAYTKYSMYAYTGGTNRDSGAWTCMSYINASSTTMRQYDVQYYFDGEQNYRHGAQGDAITVIEIAA